jgi:hypothetical protein
MQTQNQPRMTPAQKAARTRAQKRESEDRDQRERNDAAKNADAIYERLKRGDKLKWNGGRNYKWNDDSVASGYAVRALVDQQRAKHKGASIVLSSPEEYAAEFAAFESERAAKRRERLDRWTDQIAVRICTPIERGAIDDILKGIGRECVGLSDDLGD